MEEKISGKMGRTWVWMKKRLVIEREGSGEKLEFPENSYVEMPDDVYHWASSKENANEYFEVRRDLDLQRVGLIHDFNLRQISAQQTEEATPRPESNGQRLSHDELEKLVTRIGGTKDTLRDFPRSWHPDSGEKVPHWLPDWKDESEYTRLAVTTDFEYETESPSFVKQLEHDITFELRHIKPQTLRMLKSDTPKADFAWEFLRRNPAYQKEYEALVSMAKSAGVFNHYKSGLGLDIYKFGGIRPPSLSFHASLYRALSRWGFGHVLPNPAYDLHEGAPLNALGRSGNMLYPAERVAYIDNESIPVDGGIIPKDSETWWLLDTSLSMDYQLDEIKKFLELCQKRYDRKPRASNTSEKDYICYLRVLDALATGATINEIATEIYSDIIIEKYCSGSGQFTGPRKKKTLNAIKTALNLMQEGYKKILPPTSETPPKKKKKTTSKKSSAKK